MIKKLFTFLILVTLLSCQNIKDGLSGKKYESSDEFLVIKKNPLVVPPEFNSLPVPKSVQEKNQLEKVEGEIENLLSSIKSEESKEEMESDSTENFVLEKIKD